MRLNLFPPHVGNRGSSDLSSNHVTVLEFHTQKEMHSNDKKWREKYITCGHTVWAVSSECWGDMAELHIKSLVLPGVHMRKKCYKFGSRKVEITATQNCTLGIHFFLFLFRFIYIGVFWMDPFPFLQRPSTNGHQIPSGVSSHPGTQRQHKSVFIDGIMTSNSDVHASWLPLPPTPPSTVSP